MTNHLDVCPRMKVSCELGCDVIMCHEDMTQHLEVDCPEKELECPFAKYKCEMRLIKRKNMSKHLEEKRIEHLELRVILKLSELDTHALECKLLKVECNHCGSNILNKESEAHYDVCPDMDIECPNECSLS